jgi:hypothetical protein
MFFNEDPAHGAAFTVELPIAGEAYRYDAFGNTLRRAPCRRVGGASALHLELSRFESAVVVSGDIGALAGSAAPALPAQRFRGSQPVEGPWSLSLAEAQHYPRFTEALRLDALVDLSGPGLYPSFAGTIRYETSLTCAEAEPGAVLDLGEAFEVAEVWINEQSVGVRICPPYVFELGDAVRQGRNEVRIEVTNTLVRSQRDPLSMFAALEPSGLLGPVTLKFPAR